MIGIKMRSAFWHKVVFLTLVSVVLSAATLLISGCKVAQKEPKKMVVGVLNLNPLHELVLKNLKIGLHEQGFEEGKNITYLYEGVLESVADIDLALEKLLEQKPDLLVTIGTPATRKAKKVTRSTHIPVLFAPVFSPVESGIIESIAEPGGNVTGIMIRGHTTKALELFLSTVPAVKTIYVPLHSPSEAARRSYEDLEKAAKAFGIHLIEARFTNLQEFEEVLDNIPQEADALWATHSHFIRTHMRKLVMAANFRKLPTGASSGLRSKILLKYSIQPPMLGNQASKMAGKLLNGADPATMPVETAEYFLGLDLKTAKRIGVTVPQHILAIADVINRE